VRAESDPGRATACVRDASRGESSRVRSRPRAERTRWQRLRSPLEGGEEGISAECGTRDSSLPTRRARTSASSTARIGVIPDVGPSEGAISQRTQTVTQRGPRPPQGMRFARSNLSIERCGDGAGARARVSYASIQSRQLRTRRSASSAASSLTSVAPTMAEMRSESRTGQIM
jgi:hypothetical protein